MEVPGDGEEDHVVHHRAEARDASRSAHRRGEDDARRPLAPEAAGGGTGGGAGGQSVVHQEHRAAGHIELGLAAMDEPVAAFDLRPLGRDGAYEVVAGHVEQVDHRLVHPRRAGGDRADRVSGIPRGADLPGEHHVEGGVQGARHLRPDHGSPARQAEHDGTRRPPALHGRTEPPSRLHPVREHHGRPLAGSLVKVHAPA